MISNKKYRILEVANSFGSGGTERVMQLFCLGLKNQGHEVFAAAKITGEREEWLKRNGIKTISLKETNINKIIKKYEIDIVHTHFFDTTNIKKKNNKPLIIKETVFGNRTKNQDIEIAISKALYSKIAVSDPARMSKLAQIYYPQAPKYWSTLVKKTKEELKQEMKIPLKTITIGKLARAEPSKWDYIYIKTIPLLVKQKNIKLIFRGMPLLYKIWLRALTTKKNYSKIKFLPETKDDTEIAKFYKCLDVFWHAAEKGETFGLVFTEAMSFGLPIITSSTHFSGKEPGEQRDNAQIELIKQDINGYVCNDPDHILSAINKLRSKKIYQKIKENNLKEVNKYAIDKIIYDFLDLIYKYETKQKLADKTKILTEYYDLLKKSGNMKHKGAQYFLFILTQQAYLIIRKLLKLIGKDIEKIK